MIQLILELTIDIAIFISYILIIKFIIHQFNIKHKIYIWVFFFGILPTIFIVTEYINRAEPIKVIYKKFDDFKGFLYEIDRFPDDTVLELIKFMKIYPTVIKQTDFIIGYKTTYTNINNKSNLNNAKIIRLSYTKTTNECISLSEFSKYFLSHRNSYHFNYTDYNQTIDGKCLTLKHISPKEANKYQYKPPVLNYTYNHIKHTFPPFFHSYSTIYTAVAPTFRQVYAIPNKESDRNNYMIYTVTVLSLGTVQHFFSKAFQASDTQILKKFLSIR